MNNKIIICTPLKFYTQNDETFLFKWLKKIKSIKHIEGIGIELHLHVDSKTITKPELREFRGIFKRYNFENIDQIENLKIELFGNIKT